MMLDRLVVVIRKEITKEKKKYLPRQLKSHLERLEVDNQVMKSPWAVTSWKLAIS